MQKLVYTDIKATFGLSAQPAVRVIEKTVDAYAALQTNLTAGNLGKPGSKRWLKATGTPITFRPEAAQPFDDRCLSWQHDARTVSIWTVQGWLKNLGYTGHADQLKTLVQYRRGESDLICRGGRWYLIAICEVPDPEAPAAALAWGEGGCDPWPSCRRGQSEARRSVNDRAHKLGRSRPRR
ncbi:hypothetical protein [Streptomyces griseoruber]|uniref:Uncharacterized protein n=1 Tax=Streptomyces griseoruber TaxID=1943 RepID=A0A101T3T4_9ACTN|nr:hypothetical protein [Streptomyces griseoruber]KUN85224.1 hypothetical protein AQJ64_13460 [Streptomyces griseoruber]